MEPSIPRRGGSYQGPGFLGGPTAGDAPLDTHVLVLHHPCLLWHALPSTAGKEAAGSCELGGGRAHEQKREGHTSRWEICRWMGGKEGLGGDLVMGRGREEGPGNSLPKRPKTWHQPLMESFIDEPFSTKG